MYLKNKPYLCIPSLFFPITLIYLVYLTYSFTFFLLSNPFALHILLVYPSSYLILLYNTAQPAKTPEAPAITGITISYAIITTYSSSNSLPQHAQFTPAKSPGVEGLCAWGGGGIFKLF